MARYREGEIISVDEDHGDLIRVTVATPQGRVRASVFRRLTGSAGVGDRVVVNTVGIDLDLGTGGEAFVLWNLSQRPADDVSPGHIVKLRYTPLQTSVLAAEAPESPHHETLVEARSIDGMPVVACGLHAQVPAAAAGIKTAATDARVAYVMSDGGALPIAWSDLVRRSRAAGVLDSTCTYGHAFGGDFEAVNVYSALVAVRHAAGADAAVVAPGPGIVGTGTALGFTALEQGLVLDAASALGGAPVAALRISFADARARHRGLSHHSVTTLTVATRSRVTVALPRLDASEEEVRAALTPVAERHDLVEADGGPGVALLNRLGLRPGSMGRRFDEVPELFLAAAAAGAVAASRL